MLASEKDITCLKFVQISKISGSLFMVTNTKTNFVQSNNQSWKKCKKISTQF